MHPNIISPLSEKSKRQVTLYQVIQYIENHQANQITNIIRSIKRVSHRMQIRIQKQLFLFFKQIIKIQQSFHSYKCKWDTNLEGVPS